MVARRESVPRPYALYSGLIAAIAVFMLVISWRTVPPAMTPILVFLIGAVLLSENFALDVPGVGSTSLSYPLTVAGIVLLGPAGGGIIALCSGTNIADLRSRKPLSVLVFNFGQLAVSATAAGLAYMALGGRLLTSADGIAPLLIGDFPAILLPITACALVSFLANDFLVGIGIHLAYRVPLSEVWTSRLMWMVPTQLALAAVGVTIAQVLAVQYLAFLLFVLPLVLARQVYQHYLQLKAALADTIRSLINVLEAKDPYTRGHSERVAGYARALAEEMGLESREAQQLEYAAILHDIGKLTLPRHILLKPGRLDDDERELINAHPRVGATMIERISYLKGLSSIVAGHHEQFDGSGYPNGIAGTQIPRLSRLLAVVDSFDAMTTARPYRPPLTKEQAIAELQRCSGTQFDPEVVDAFCGMDVDLLEGVGTQAPASGAPVVTVPVGAES